MKAATFAVAIVSENVCVPKKSQFPLNIGKSLKVN